MSKNFAANCVKPALTCVKPTRLMRFTKMLLTLVLTALAAVSYGQSVRDELYANPDKAGGVYYVYTYDNPVRTPAPKGYEPFYISHYGRHGSRWLLRASEYTEVLETFEKAAARGALTELGEDAYRRVKIACEDGRGRAGDLTPLGVEQHHGIAERMYRAYPEIFRGKGVQIDAQSTVVVRCVLSMAAFCEQLQKLNPAIEITRTANNRTTSYLNFFNAASNPDLAPEYLDMLKKDKVWKAAEQGFRERKLHPERLMASLFEEDYVAELDDPREVMQQLWSLAVNMQDTDLDISFYDLFTPDELYAVWECVNYRFYNYRGPGPMNRGYAQYYATALLREIVERADKALAAGAPSADLRFGHDGNLMPLVNLLRLEGCTAVTDDPDRIAEVWQDFRISPMAANVQLVFYRKRGCDDLLVKLLHNEKEVRIPLDSDSAPYYRWQEVRAFYLGLIAATENPAKQ